MLELINVSKSFDNHQILDKINWQLKPSTIYGLVGKNGVGKSTLLRCIADVYPIDDGVILYNEINAIDNPNIKKKIIFVSDEPFSYSAATLKELEEFYTIFYPHFNHAIYNELVSLFNFDENQLLAKMSKGVKRQSSIIIALSLTPEVLLLDESFDGLDPLVRHKLSQFLKKQTQMTIVISSHNVNDLSELCDEIVILKGTQLYSKESIIQNDNLTKVQIGFTYDVTKEQLSFLNPLHHEIVGRVHTLILQKDVDSIKQALHFLHPALIYPLEVNLNELFILKCAEDLYE